MDSRAFIILFFFPFLPILIYLGFEFSKLKTLQKNFQKSKRARAFTKNFHTLVVSLRVCAVRISKKNKHDNDKDDDDFLLAHFSFEFFVRVSVVWYFKEQQQLSARRRKRKEATEKSTSASSGRSGWEKKEQRNERGNKDEHHVGGGKIVISRRLHSLRRRGPMRENDPSE